MDNILVVAVHPDDETLGCGGTILRHAAEGSRVSWLICTEARESEGWAREFVLRREKEIAAVAAGYKFDRTFRLGFPTTTLDSVPMRELAVKIKRVIDQVRPQVVYAPFFGDVHTDHQRISRAVWACVKSFRAPSVRRVLMYEALSETEQALPVEGEVFAPNVFVDVSKHLERKLKIMKMYASELKAFPFPRSEKAIRALAALRGASSGLKAAEAFMLMKEIR